LEAIKMKERQTPKIAKALKNNITDLNTNKNLPARQLRPSDNRVDLTVPVPAATRLRPVEHTVPAATPLEQLEHTVPVPAVATPLEPVEHTVPAANPLDLQEYTVPVPAALDLQEYMVPVATQLEPVEHAAPVAIPLELQEYTVPVPVAIPLELQEYTVPLPAATPLELYNKDPHTPKVPDQLLLPIPTLVVPMQMPTIRQISKTLPTRKVEFQLLQLHSWHSAQSFLWF
jgi:hypothetical protein